MNEQEAKAKWCPMYRYSIALSPAGDYNPHDNRPPTDLTSQALCMGSGCMAWRWVQGFPLPNDPPAISERYQGFCGLAGKP